MQPDWGDIVCEVPDGKVGELSITYTVIGEVTDSGSAGIRQCGDHHGRGAECLDRDPGEGVPDQIRRCKEHRVTEGPSYDTKDDLCLQT